MAAEGWHSEDDPPALHVRLGQAAATLDVERAAAPSRVGRLLSLPDEVRLQELQRDHRFHTWGVAELLLETAQKEEGDPAKALPLLSLALGAAERLDPAVHEPPMVKDLEARIWAALGDSRRRAGEAEGAETALRHAARCLARGSGDLLVEARLLEFEAALRQDEGRLGEADALLRQASSRFLETHQFHDLARVLAARELLLRVSPAPYGGALGALRQGST